MTPIRHTNTILYCQDFSGCVAFYRDTLGLPIVERTEWRIEFGVCGGASISVADISRTRQTASRGITVTFLVDDADLRHRRLAAAGAPITAPTLHPDGTRGFFVTDPDGNRLEFWSRRTPSQPSGRG